MRNTVTYSLLLLIMFITGCSRVSMMKSYMRGEMHIPDKAASYPKLTERNRLIGELTPLRTCYDVNFYDMNITIKQDENALQINGYVDIHAKATIEFETLQIDLAEKMTVDDIIFDSTTMKWTRKEDAVFIEFPTITKGQLFSFRVKYNGKPQVAKRPPWDGGVVIETDKAGRPFLGVACEGDGASLWWPNKDHPTEEPDSMAMNVTVDSSLICVMNGKLRDVHTNGDAKTWQWFVSNPVNNYNVTFNIGHYVEIRDTVHSLGVVRPLSYWVLDYNKTVATEHLKEARDVIRFMERRFGEYPFWDDGYKLIETPYLGMEHQSAIAYGNTFKIFDKSNRSMYGSLDYITLHESFHEWWGNSITACDGADVWIQEGFTTYCEALYIENRWGYDLSIDYLLKQRKNIRNRKAMVGPRGQYYWGFEDAYYKGSWILHTLRNVIDDDVLFFDILKSFAAENAKSIVCTEDAIAFVSAKTGQDFNPFFRQYLYDRKPPTFEYKQSGGIFNYRWKDVRSDFYMPVDILVNREEIRLFPTLETQTIDIPEHATIQIKDWEFLLVKELIN
ncbi:MAG: M1 family metallopeptidase [Candidatus Marinimicrobia bacterium]|nr:M1 family metallopeptidase [Candidatus Neomarinimicrobiota bacterium]